MPASSPGLQGTLGTSNQYEPEQALQVNSSSLSHEVRGILAATLAALDSSHSSGREGAAPGERDTWQLLAGTRIYRAELLPPTPTPQVKQPRTYLHERVTLGHKVPFGDLLEFITDVWNTAGFQYEFLVLLN